MPRGRTSQALKDLAYMRRRGYITEAEYTCWSEHVRQGHAQQRWRLTSTDLTWLRQVWPATASPKSEVRSAKREEPPEADVSPSAISPRKSAALAKARSTRATAAPRHVPEGFRSIEHFLDSVREAAGSRAGGVMDLARYLNVGEKSVRRWLRREKIPLQPTIDAMARWRVMHKQSSQ